MSSFGTEERPDEIAVVGMACRFPGADNVEEFWRNLRGGVESVKRYTDEELRAAGVPDSVLARPNYVKAAAALEGIELFDAAFFGFSPREAEITNPQHRLFLECAWEALESAGYDSEQYTGRVGVYAGAGMNYYLLNIHSNRDLAASVGDFRINLGNDKDHLPTWVSYKLNLKGPSINVQTACSTSLVAIHLACQSLLNGECDMALAGGASVTALGKAGYLYQEGGIASPDGHCRAFDEQARGTLSGNGVGVVILKRHADARADGDTVYALVKGSGANNDGSLKVGYTAPSVEGQAEVIADALAMADADARTITYVEAHGTGTALGDPIEVAALTKAFRAYTDAKGFCAIGSLKTNVGHMDVAAGVGGFIKTVLALGRAELPPSLHFVRPNPKLELESSPFYVNSGLAPWRVDEGPRRAGVSSFGIGGTNAHVILEEAPVESHAPARAEGDGLLPLSARTPAALEAATANLLAHLRKHPELDLADVAYTLQVGRRAFNQRRALVCRDVAQAVELLEAQRAVTGVRRQVAPAVAMLFPGQGAQHVGMSGELYRTEPLFRAEVDRCAEIITPALGEDLRRVLYAEAHAAAEASARLEQTSLTQPVLFVVEYALAKLWMRWGVKPDAMIGHSIGEYVAACLSGVFTLEEALGIVVLRGRLMQELPRGAMLSVALGEEELRPHLSAQLSVAAVNGAGRTVVAGERAAVEELSARLAELNVSCKPLRTSHAFHSPMVEPAVGPFVRHLGTLNLKPPRIPFISNVTGTWITDAEATDPLYWGRHLRRPVRFADGVAELLGRPELVLLEVGPGQTLCTLARLSAGAAGREVIPSLAGPTRGAREHASMLAALGRLWVEGVPVNWAALHEGGRPRRLPLPTYPFERQRFWVERARAQPSTAVPRAAAEEGQLHDASHADEAEQLIAQQLKVMAQQLEVLRNF